MIVCMKAVKNRWYHFVGGIIIILNFVRHTLLGYRTPRTFSGRDIEKSLEYDFSVIQGWLKGLAQHGEGPEYIRDKVILELGPGPDLGIGLILLAMGARKYVAFDVNPLAGRAPRAFYEALFRRLKEMFRDCDIASLREELRKAYAGEKGRLSYMVDKKFHIAGIGEHPDLVFSQDTFEHFADIEKTFAELNRQSAKRCILIAGIDLKTHTRWIRNKDALNIYRYSEGFWRAFQFSGAPNRLRSFEYKNVLERNGWERIIVEPVAVLDDAYVERVKQTLSASFKHMDSKELKLLKVRICAEKNT